MKKRIYPHPFLLIGGSFYLFLYYACPIWFIYLSIDDYVEGEVILQILLCIFFALAAFGMGFMFHYQTFCRMLITDKYIKFYGFLLPTVKIKIEDVKYVDIRTFDKGNVCYEKYGNRSADSYKFILISSNPLPTKRIDKIRPSKKRNLIKFAVNYKLCKALFEVLPKEKSKIIDYQLFLYKKGEEISF